VHCLILAECSGNDRSSANVQMRRCCDGLHVQVSRANCAKNACLRTCVAYCIALKVYMIERMLHTLHCSQHAVCTIFVILTHSHAHLPGFGAALRRTRAGVLHARSLRRLHDGHDGVACCSCRSGCKHPACKQRADARDFEQVSLRLGMDSTKCAVFVASKAGCSLAPARLRARTFDH